MVVTPTKLTAGVLDMNRHLVWGLVLVAIGIALFVTTPGNSSRAVPAGIITGCLGLFRIVRGLSARST
jgi:hypothetical protein